MLAAVSPAAPGRWARAAGTPSATTADEETLIHKGVELRRARDDLAARAEFQKAYDLTHSPRAAAQLGLAEFALGRFEDAEAHVSEALHAQSDPWINKHRKELDQSLANLQTHVARVEVIGDPLGAEVYVNGRLSGRLPLDNPVTVSEGQVDVELRAPGFERGSRTITLSGQQYQRLVIRLARDRGAAVAAVPGGAGPIGLPSVGSRETVNKSPSAKNIVTNPASSGSARRPLAWGLVGAGAAVATAGGVLMIIEAGHASKAREDHDPAAWDAAKGPWTAGLIGVITGGFAAAVGLGVLALARGDEAPNGVGATAWLSGTHAGLRVGGRW